MLYFGIDPGLDGCLVVLDFRGRLVGVHNLPAVKIGTKREFLVVDFARVVRGYVKEVGADNIRATVERHLPMPKQGISSQCKGAGIVGSICGVLAGCNISYMQVHPRTWTKVQRFRFIDLAICIMVEPTTLDHIGKKGRSTSGRV